MVIPHRTTSPSAVRTSVMTLAGRGSVDCGGVWAEVWGPSENVRCLGRRLTGSSAVATWRRVSVPVTKDQAIDCSMDAFSLDSAMHRCRMVCFCDPVCSICLMQQSSLHRLSNSAMQQFVQQQCTNAAMHQCTNSLIRTYTKIVILRSRDRPMFATVRCAGCDVVTLFGVTERCSDAAIRPAAMHQCSDSYGTNSLIRTYTKIVILRSRDRPMFATVRCAGGDVVILFGVTERCSDAVRC
jgi:hypothetical protein